MDSEQLNPVDVLAAEFAEKLKAGENPTIDAYAKQYPEHADTIRAMFPSIRMMERVSKQERVEQKFDRRTRRLTGQDGEQLGDFKILREVGRGGMGIVYEAMQQSLRRRVALKVLAPHIADSETQLKRFRREAKSAARLHHTNIVPVYGVGESEGLHFIAMQFIDGVTLQQKMDGQTTQPDRLSSATFIGESKGTAPTHVPGIADYGQTSETATTDAVIVPAACQSASPLREAARIVRDTANAMAYAHEHGVLHRDIKPGNLLLDDAGTVWITDFGLAKHESDEAATQTGDLVGTVRYMAPEQFNGTDDARSDIYSLGMTLYELLTNQPAYPPMKTVALMQLKTNEPPPSPRTIVKNLPADLETITLKACATDPDHRYQTANELAADLARFLEDRPILARRVTPIERLWRWAKRNPTIAALSTATAVLLATTAIVFAIGNYNTAQALSTVEVEKLRAETNLTTALDAFEEIMLNISSRGVTQSLAIDIDGEEFNSATSVVTAADADLLETLLDFFDRLSQENGTDLSQKTADALARVGAIQQKLGRTSEARDAYARSITTYEEFVRNDPQSAARTQLARVHRQVMKIAAKEGDTSNLLHHFKQSRSLLRGSTEPGDQFELAMTLGALATAVVDTKRITETIRLRVGPGRGGRGRGGRARNGGGQGGPENRRFGPGGGLQNQSRPNQGRPPRWPGNRAPENAWRGQLANQAAEASVEAIEILEQLVATDESNQQYRLELGRAHRHIELHKDRQVRIESINAALDEFRFLAARHPGSTLYQYELATTLCNREASNKVKHAVRVVEATRIARGLVASYPEVPEYEVLLARALTERNRTRRDGPGAEEGWRESVEIYRRLHDRFPTSSLYVLSLASQMRSLAIAAGFDNPAAARLVIQEATELLDNIPDSQTVGSTLPINGLRRELENIANRIDESQNAAPAP
jgi:serine/threonine protein kinase